MVKRLFQHRENGFTLIELLVVITILGILAGATVPNLTKYIDSGVVGAANAELATVKNSVSGFIADNGGLFPCLVQPTVGNPQPVVEASILPYIGLSGVKGGYLADSNGLVYGDPANAYPGLTWDTTNGKWEKS
jgi:prepilin-type N-terminal cleavage/methylation domain-containing protein